MVDPRLPISIRRQCSLLSFTRSAYYYEPRPVSDDDLKLMNRIDEIFTDNPDYGSRFMRKILKREDCISVNRKRIVRLMRKMGICAIYPGKNTSAPGKRPSAPDLPIPATGPGHNPAEPCLEHRHHLYPPPPGSSLPGRCHGLGNPEDPVVGGLPDDGLGILHLCPTPGTSAMGNPTDIQHRPGGSVYQPRFPVRSQRKGNQDQHGR